MWKLAWDINWLNWEQDTPYLWPAWWFQSAVWVDIRKEPPFIKLSSEMTLLWTFDDNIICQKNLEDFGLDWTIVCLDNGKIYLDWDQPWDLKTTLVSWNAHENKIRAIWYLNVWGTDYLYYFTETSNWSWKMHRSDTALTSFSINHKSFVVNGWNVITEYPIIQEAARFVIWINNTIFEVDNITEDLTEKLEFSDYEKVVWMTVFQNNYRIYSSVWESPFTHWIQYFWDWVSLEYDYKISWNNLPFLWVVSDWAYDYVVAWFSWLYSKLFKVAWSQKQEIKANVEWWWTGSRSFSGYISIRKWIVYISWINKEWNRCVYTLWTYYPWFSESLVWEYTLSSTPDSAGMLFHTHNPATSYFAKSDDKVYSISYNNPPDDYILDWYVTTKKRVWTSIYTLKSIDYMYVWYKLESDTSITIKASNWNWTFLTLATITDTTKKWIRIEANEFQAIDLWDFYELELKFILTTTDSSKTPALWRTTVFCHDNYNK